MACCLGPSMLPRISASRRWRSAWPAPPASWPSCPSPSFSSLATSPSQQAEGTSTSRCEAFQGWGAYCGDEISHKLLPPPQWDRRRRRPRAARAHQALGPQQQGTGATGQAGRRVRRLVGEGVPAARQLNHDAQHAGRDGVESGVHQRDARFQPTIASELSSTIIFSFFFYASFPLCYVLTKTGISRAYFIHCGLHVRIVFFFSLREYYSYILYSTSTGCVDCAACGVRSLSFGVSRTPIYCSLRPQIKYNYKFIQVKVA